MSISSRKAYARQVNLTQGSAKRTKSSTSLEFDDADLDGVSLPHDDALFITLRIDTFQIKRILVDTGSSVDIIFKDVFNQMGISDDREKPISSSLYSFTGASAPVKGIAPLTVVTGEAPRQAVHTLDFLIVKVKSSYNGILGRTGLNKLQAVASTYHLIMKFSSPTGVGFVKGDQILARRCYAASCKAEETLSIDDQQDEKALRIVKPVEVLDGQQLPIYYVSKVLQEAEQRYSNAEKLAFALQIAARKLWPYFQSHTIIVLIDKPLKRILYKPDLSGRLVPWSIELGDRSDLTSDTVLLERITFTNPSHTQSIPAPAPASTHVPFPAPAIPSAAPSAPSPSNSPTPPPSTQFIPPAHTDPSSSIPFPPSDPSSSVPHLPIPSHPSDPFYSSPLNDLSNLNFDEFLSSDNSDLSETLSRLYFDSPEAAIQAHRRQTYLTTSILNEQNRYLAHQIFDQAHGFRVTRSDISPSRHTGTDGEAWFFNPHLPYNPPPPRSPRVFEVVEVPTTTLSPADPSSSGQGARRSAPPPMIPPPLPKVLTAVGLSIF
ncbi:hypothetical protein RJ639_004164 [Escallonia herrerae]|uniref:Reverse transcriptase RNase H-like domain-containing protein n=1 Tax=Escallonia herrerae TaxID=1293975 RepID=A0AA88W4J9_9ASTE|nr:hypothetical protein RJ639_004164 [Escallonia herrerae]